MIQKSNKSKRQPGADPPKSRGKNNPIQKSARSKPIQNGLQMDEGGFRQFLEAVPDGLVIVNAQGEIQFVNKQIGGMFGYPPEEMLGKPVELLIPDRFGGHKENREAYLRNLHTRPMESGLVLFAARKDQTEFQAEISLSPLKIEEKTYIIAAIRDVTLQKMSEKQLKQGLERHQQLLDNMLEGCQIIDFDWRYIYVNDVAASQGHRKPEEFLMRTMMEVYPGIEKTEMFTVLKHCMEECVPHQMENRFENSDGTASWFKLSIQPVPEGVFILSIDITERKRAEEALRESEASYQTLIESASDGIFISDRQARYVDVNALGCRMLGYTREEMLALSIPDIISPEEMPRVLSEVARLNPGEVVRSEWQFRRKDGTLFVGEVSGTSLPDGRLLGILRDITERRQVEEEIQSLARFPSENPNPVVRLTPDGRILYANKTSMPLLDSWGRQVGQIVGDEWQQLIREAFASGLNKEIEIEHAGQTFSCMLTPIQGAGYVNLYGRDITERKQAEEALRVSEERFRSLYENSTIGMYRTTSDGKILFANPALVSMLGYSSFAELSQRDLEKEGYEPGYERSLFRQKIENDGVLIGLESVWTKKDGAVIFVRESAKATRDAEGKVIYYDGTVEDITGRKQAEEEIRTRTDELRTLYELSRALADADDLDEILNQVNRHVVESVHTTFARVALLEGDNFVMRAAYPVRTLDHDLLVGKRVPLAMLPYCQRVLEQNKSVILRNNSQEISSDERAALLLDFAQSLCLIPLRVGRPGIRSKQTLGLLMLGETRSESREPFTPAKILLSESIGDQAASAIRRMLLYEQTELRLQHLTALREIDQAIASSFGLDLSLRMVLTQVTEQLSVDAATVWLFNSASNMLEYSASRGFHSKAFEQAKPLRLGEGYAGRAALEHRMIHISNLAEQKDNPRLIRALANEAFISYYGVPLIAKGSIKGVLEVFQRVPLEPDEEWLDFLDILAGQAAIAIDNATLFENLQNSNTDLILAYDTTLEGWSAALDLRDKETEGHTQRVTEITVRLAEAMGFSQQELVQVRRGALLHDIGKMGVPDRILLKPDKLTDEEWEIMRRHPAYAYQLLKGIAYLHQALDIPYCHHEKWDGTGYPRGLKAEEIPLAARAFAVVDIYDALTSDRPYRQGWTREKTLNYIRELSGTHLDPQVVEAFLKMVGKDE